MQTLHFKPPVIAHRGASAYAPENTLVAFTQAAQLGIKWLEFDVMLSSDGVPLIFHDEELSRIARVKGEVSQFPFNYLQSLDIGKWFNPRFSGERIPSLRQVLDQLQLTKQNVNIEIKAQRGQEKKEVENIVHVVKPYLTQHDSTILFSSFSTKTLEYLRAQLPHCLIGLLLHEWVDGWQKIAVDLNCVSIHVNQAIMTQEAATVIKGMDKNLLCYTVNAVDRALVLYSFGVDAVFSDIPDIIAAAYEEKNNK